MCYQWEISEVIALTKMIERRSRSGHVLSMSPTPISKVIGVWNARLNLEDTLLRPRPPPLFFALHCASCGHFLVAISDPNHVAPSLQSPTPPRSPLRPY